MKKKCQTILLFFVSIWAVGAIPANASTIGGKTITLLYSGDMHGHIRPVSE